MSDTLHEIPLRRIDGSETRLADFRGNVLLIVNVASQCGFDAAVLRVTEPLRALPRARLPP